MKTHSLIKLNISLLLFLSCLSCKKDWLDAKPKLSLVVPSTIADYQAILDNDVNTSPSSGQVGFNSGQSILDEISAGDFYVTDANYNPRTAIERNAYIWASEIFTELTPAVYWDQPYTRIFFTNVVLEGIEKNQPADNSEQVGWNNVKGSALFFRAYNHYNIAQAFCKEYGKNTAGNDLGIPLRLESDVNIPSVRSTVQQTYDAIINDLKQAAGLLPTLIPVVGSAVSQTRPNKAAANGMLARVYLSMENYDSAWEYSNKSLQLYSTLMNFNSNPPVNPSAANPFPRFNAETLFYNTYNGGFFRTVTLIVDSTLYLSYVANDWRKTAYFLPLGTDFTFKGNYNASTSTYFSGLATDEMYLIRAECYARKNNTASALQDLNALLITRWKTGTFSPVTAADANDALKKIVAERRKELCFRGIRWSDLRRLNKDTQFAVTLKRKINGQTYTLPPNDLRYVLPIPDYVIQLTGMPQNPR